MFDTFTDDVLKAEVTTRSGNLKNCQALGIITGIKEEKTRNGPMAIVECTLLKVVARDPADTNAEGEKIARTYPLYGSADKKSYFTGLLKKDMCHLASVDYRKVDAAGWKQVGTAAGAGAFQGMLVSFDPYEFETNGAMRIGHNMTKIPGRNEVKDVLARAALLNSGETKPEAFL